jgi:hypothetical protein
MQAIRLPRGHSIQFSFRDGFSRRIAFKSMLKQNNHEALSWCISCRYWPRKACKTKFLKGKCTLVNNFGKALTGRDEKKATSAKRAALASLKSHFSSGLSASSNITNYISVATILSLRIGELSPCVPLLTGKEVCRFSECDVLTISRDAWTSLWTRRRLRL